MTGDPDQEGGFRSGEWLSDLGLRSGERFARARRILGYGEYLEEVAREPGLHLRDASRWILDMFDHYGTREVRYPWGTERRFLLFDQAFAGGGDGLVGQEAVQNEFYKALQGFVRDGRPTRMVLLHGPNGSSKTTFVQCVMRAMEHYSTLDEGVRYRIAWIFPRESGPHGRLGFLERSRGRIPPGATYAHLEDADIEVRLGCDLKDHPLLCLPGQERHAFLAGLGDRRGDRIPDLIGRSGLCPKCKLVFDSLMVAYKGALDRVLAHVQVERYYVSRGYRRGAVSIGPQMSVDAHERQVTMDRSLSALPAMLARVSLYEYGGDLVDGSGGIVEFSDLFKRPLETTKYLLATLENGEVGVGQSILRIDAVILGTTNEVYLAALRQQPEYMSYLGRLVLVRVPYILHEPTERRIYETQVAPRLGVHVAPHAIEAVAEWAVLSRLHRPDRTRYEGEASGVVSRLEASEKMDLYATGRTPARLGKDEAAALAGALPGLVSETDQEADYEGSIGASAREAKLVLYRAAQDPANPCLTPMGVLGEIESLHTKVKDFPFLSLEAEEGGYHDVKGFVSGIRARIIGAVEMEAMEVSGLLASGGYADLWRRYVTNAIASVKGEKIRNASTRKDEDPDATLMEEVERGIGAGDAASFRQEVMSRIAAFKIEHGKERIDLASLFARHVEALERHGIEANRPKLARLVEEAVAAARDGKGGGSPILAGMVERFGYCPSCAASVLAWLFESRLRDA